MHSNILPGLAKAGSKFLLSVIMSEEFENSLFGGT